LRGVLLVFILPIYIFQVWGKFKRTFLAILHVIVEFCGLNALLKPLNKSWK
jgi:hypothetical protein